MDFRDKIIPFTHLAAWRAQVRAAGKRLVVTNGCFDILHAGHVTYLAAARGLGDALLVGLNSDASVRALKGAGRPVNAEHDRATVLAALAAVDGVCVFAEVDALRFLGEVQPDIYAKGGDYTDATLPEAGLVRALGGEVRFLPYLEGVSITGLIAQIRAVEQAAG